MTTYSVMCRDEHDVTMIVQGSMTREEADRMAALLNLDVMFSGKAWLYYVA
jgi:hypothetical protein